jgi:uncharacterized tellurite resistance protein B-like protein
MRNFCVLKRSSSSPIVAHVLGDVGMPFLIAILGVLGAAAFWWYRMKAMNEAAREVADVVGRVQGNIRRKKLRKQAALSPLTAIDDPVVAAATLITAIVSENGPILPQREAVIRAVISEIADKKKTDEAVIYAKWAASQIDDTTVVIDKLAPFLRERLDVNERNDLLQMVNRAAQGGEKRLEIADQRMLRLRQKLGFEVN